MVSPSMSLQSQIESNSYTLSVRRFPRTSLPEQ